MHKKLLSALCGLAAAFASAALAQDSYPNRAVRMLVPNAPGSSIDTMSRIVAAKLGDALGQSVRSEEHTSELQSHSDLVCRLLLEKKNTLNRQRTCPTSRRS